MSNNIPALLIGGSALAAGVYFITKSKDSVVEARKRREADISRGGPAMVTVKMDDPPLQGAQIADSCAIERRGDWSKENPKFVLSCDGAVFTDFDHKRQFQPDAGHPTYGTSRCGGRCNLYKPGSNPNAKYPSEFVETTKGIAAILGTIGQGVTGAFQAKSNFDIQKASLRTGGGSSSQNAALIAALSQPQKSNTGLITTVAVGGIAMVGMMFFMMNKKEA